METETKTPGLRITPSVAYAGQFTVMADDGSPVLVLTRTQLEQIVQGAYDLLGIVAEPSFAQEAAIAEHAAEFTGRVAS